MIVSIFKNIHSTSTGFTRSASILLDRIKNEESKSLIKKIRKEKDKSTRNELKKQLPSVCWSGVFNQRSDKGLQKHSGLICLDFDAFPDKDTFLLWKDSLTGNEYSLAVFKSPSGDGLKVLFKIPECTAKEHKRYFQSIQEYFDCPYFDISCSNVSRVCYESSDPDIYINMDAKQWTELPEEETMTFGSDTPQLILQNENQIIQNVMTWWNKNYSMTEGSRNENLFKLAIAFSDYGITQSDTEYTCRQFIREDFNELEIQSLIRSAYKKGFRNFGTKFFEDTSTFKKIEVKIKEGVTQKEIIKAFPDHPSTAIEDAVHSIKTDSTVIQFWDYNQQGQIQLKPHKFKEFLEQHGFIKIYPSGSETPIFVEMNSNIIDGTSHQRIKDFVLGYLLKNIAEFGTKPYDYLASKTGFFKDEFLNLINSVDINFKRDTKDYCYLYFRNCALEIGKNKVTPIDYLNLDGFIWKKTIIDRDFEIMDHHDSEYRKFLWLISGKNVGRYNSLKSVVGYMSHSYKPSSGNVAVILNDEVISDNPNGGSGKGIFCSALKKIKRVSILDGKQFDFKKSFAFQTVGADTQVLVFDDVVKNFPFEQSFSIITEGITLEKKNKDAIKIPASDSPKILITTNYTIGGVGGSFERRKFEVELSSYFGAHYTPLQEFGHSLFDDWSDHEWLMFDNFMIQCVQFYLNNGLVAHEFENLEQRKFIKETAFEFYQYAVEDGSIEKTVKHDKKEMYYKFIEEYPDFKKWLTQRKFSQWVELYALHTDANFIKGKTGGNRWVMFSTQPKGSEEPEEMDQNNHNILPF